MCHGTTIQLKLSYINLKSDIKMLNNMKSLSTFHKWCKIALLILASSAYLIVSYGTKYNSYIASHHQRKFKGFINDYSKKYTIMWSFCDNLMKCKLGGQNANPSCDCAH